MWHHLHGLSRNSAIPLYAEVNLQSNWLASDYISDYSETEQFMPDTIDDRGKS